MTVKIFGAQTQSWPGFGPKITIKLGKTGHDNDDAGNRRQCAKHFRSSMHHEHDGDTVGIEVLCNVRDDVSQASESSNAGTGKNSNHTDDGGKHNAGACDAEAAVLSNVDQVGDETGLLQAFSKEGSNEDQADGTC